MTTTPAKTSSNQILQSASRQIREDERWAAETYGPVVRRVAADQAAPGDDELLRRCAREMKLSAADIRGDVAALRRLAEAKEAYDAALGSVYDSGIPTEEELRERLAQEDERVAEAADVLLIEKRRLMLLLEQRREAEARIQHEERRRLGQAEQALPARVKG